MDLVLYEPEPPTGTANDDAPYTPDPDTPKAAPRGLLSCMTRETLTRGVRGIQ